MTRPCVLGSTNGPYLQRWWSPRLAWAGRLTLPSAFLVLVLAGLALAETPQGTAFSYQGTLLQGGVPVNASVDLVFDLFDAPVAGNQVAPSTPFTAANGNPVSVQGGVFTVALDFGPLAFNSPVSQERYLQVTVNGDVLSPRTKIENAPYALQSRTAELAYTVANASIGAAQIAPAGIGLIQIDATQVQARVSGVCASGEKVLSIAADGSVGCAVDAIGGAGTVTNIASGTGLTGGPITNSGTLSIANGGVGIAQINSTQVQARVTGSCAAGEYLRGINADGTVACAAVTGAPRDTRLDTTTVDINGSYTSIAIGSDGLPVLSYYDATNRDLKVAHCRDSACTDTTIPPSAIVVTGDVGRFSSIAIGANGLPIVSFLDVTTKVLDFVQCADVECASAAPVVLLSPTGPLPAGTISNGSTSIAVAADGTPIVSFVNYVQNGSGTAIGQLTVAHCSDAACTSWQFVGNPVVLDASANVGQYNSIAIGGDGAAVISYFDSTNGHLKVAHCADVYCSGTSVPPITLDSTASAGTFTSIKAGSDGLPIVSYYASAHLKVAHCGDAVCTAALATLTTVDNAPAVGRYSSLAIGTDAMPVISYYDATKTLLKVAHCTTVTCSSAVTTTVDSTPTAGQFSSLTIGADGLPVMSYMVGNPGTLKVLKCNNRSCL